MLANANPKAENLMADGLPPSVLLLSDASPSVNPSGALVAVSNSLMRGNMKDEEVVVVADVFSNGLAQIAEVVEPTNNWKTVNELERAFGIRSRFRAVCAFERRSSLRHGARNFENSAR